MNLYLDSSALLKRYLVELGTPETRQVIEKAAVQSTTVVSRAEVAAALAKTVRTETLTQKEARSALETFRRDWTYFSQQQVTDEVLARAERLAFEDGLRGYDAVQLASAIVWQQGLGEDVTFATFDRQLWAAAGQHALTPFPDDLPRLLETWRQG